MNEKLKLKAEEFINECNSMFNKGMEMTIEILKDIGATKNNPIKFDLKNSPYIISASLSNNKERIECYITKLYYDEDVNGIFADLNADYYGNKTNVYLNDDESIDWIYITTVLLYVDEPPIPFFTYYE